MFGVGLLFWNGRSLIGWLLTAAGAIFILAGVLANLHIYFQPATLFHTLVMLVLLVGGLGLIARALSSATARPAGALCARRDGVAGRATKNRLPQERQCLGTRPKPRISSSQKLRGMDGTISRPRQRGQRKAGGSAAIRCLGSQAGSLNRPHSPLERRRAVLGWSSCAASFSSSRARSSCGDGWRPRPLARRLATRFVAGRNPRQALAVSRRLNSEGITVTLDHLGESVTTLDEAAAARDVYLRTLTAIHDSGIRGQRLPEADPVRPRFLVRRSAAPMSSSWCGAPTSSAASCASIWNRASIPTARSTWWTDLHADIRRGGRGDPGVPATAARRISRMLCAARIRVRLCKGAYLEPPAVAFPQKADVDRNYIELMKILLDQRRLSGDRHARSSR